MKFMPDIDITFAFYVKVHPRAGAGLPDADARVLPGAVRHRHGRILLRKFKYAVLIIVIARGRDHAERRPGRPRGVRRADAGALPRSASAWRGCSARRRERRRRSRIGWSSHATEGDSRCRRCRRAVRDRRRRVRSAHRVDAGPRHASGIASTPAALAAIESEYVEPVEAAQLVDGSIDGMLRTLDPHSSFLDPRDYARMREQQEGPLPRHRHQHRRAQRRDHRDCRCSKDRRPIAPASAATTSSPASASARNRERPGRTSSGKRPRAGRPKTSSSASAGRKGTTVRDLDPPARRRHAHRPDGRARRDQDHDRADGVHDRAGHRLRPAAGLLGDHERRSWARR